MFLAFKLPNSVDPGEMLRIMFAYSFWSHPYSKVKNPILLHLHIVLYCVMVVSLQI